MNFRILFFVFFVGFMNQTNAQEHHENHNHDHHKNEIGIANAPVFFVKEKQISYGLHLHYIRNIKDSKFGIGAGFERIFDNHGHSTLGLVTSYRPIDRLSLNLSPGVTIEDSNPQKLLFAFHIESTYEFEFNNIHLGPAVELAYDPEDWHISIGLHIGYGF